MKFRIANWNVERPLLNTKKTTGTPANIENTDRFYFENEAGAINPAFIALADLGEDFIISTREAQVGWSINQKDKDSKTGTLLGQVNRYKKAVFQESLCCIYTNID